MRRASTMPRLAVLVSAVAIVALSVALAVFEPWRLFTSTTVVEPAPVGAAPSPSASAATVRASSAPGPVVLATGRFVSHEHRTTGTARLIRLGDGSAVVRLEDLDTSDGPALHVWLTDQPVRAGSDGWHVFDDGRHLDLGDLKGNKGDQNYPVPAGTDLRGLTSVSIWCARFHVSFGAAPLTATG